MTDANQQIHSLLASQGPISFARFMEIALYCPLYGFYEKKRDTTGKRGDFYTSVSVGPLFGELLAFQFANWLTANPDLSRLRLVEAGAHDGQLAKDILGWLQRQRSSVFAQLEYCLVEPSAQRKSWQQKTLKDFADKVSWMTDLPAGQSANTGNAFTIVFSNELLDAFPVHRLGWDASAKTWFERGVAAEEDRFVWTRLAQATIDLATALNVSADLLAVLPNGFTTEVCPAAQQWWRDAAKLVTHGKLLTLDYGLNSEEFFAPQRANGTLRAYRQHQLGADVLADPGEQDLTAHVNFSAIESAGRQAGLKTEFLDSQAQFLTRIAADAWKPENNFGPWTQETSRQFQTLTHPSHLGRAFRVLQQAR